MAPSLDYRPDQQMDRGRLLSERIRNQARICGRHLAESLSRSRSRAIFLRLSKHLCALGLLLLAPLPDSLLSAGQGSNKAHEKGQVHRQ
jgi:hypothetical protein